MSIRVALCVSGKWTGINFTDQLREIIPHDNYYTTTYTTCDYDSTFKMIEPELSYHPIKDIEPCPEGESRARREIFEPHVGSKYKTYVIKNSPHWYKQILIHNYTLKHLKEYDIIVRARFETIVSNKIDWRGLIEECYYEEIPMGFNTRVETGNLFHHRLELAESEKYFINDALIIHPRHFWNTDYVDELYNQKKLRGAEEGWYQVLSEPNSMFHESYHGGAYSAKDWEMVLDVDASLHNHSS